MRNDHSSDAISDQILRAAVHQTGDAVYVTDPEGTIEYVNPAFEEITGYERDEVIGQTPRILNSGEHDESFYENLWETITAGEQWQTEIVDETKCGDKIVLEQTISPITTADGDVQKFVAIARDITDRKQRERDLDRFKRIQSRVLRHDLRNRLNIVKAHAEYCARTLDSEYTDRAERVISVTNELETVTEQTRTIERLLNQDLTPTTISLRDELRSIVERSRDQFPQVSFTVDCPRPCTVEAIPETSLALRNLIDNAARHNDSPDPTVTVRVRTGTAATVVTISDNGSGIPEKELAALQQREVTPLNHGSGLGLWLVSWVLEKADVSFTYETGEAGTDFTILFPDAPE